MTKTTDSRSFEGSDRILGDDIPALDLPEGLFNADGQAIIVMKVRDIALGVQEVTLYSFVDILVNEEPVVLLEFMIGSRGCREAVDIAFNWVQASAQIHNQGTNYDFRGHGYPLVISRA